MGVHRTCSEPNTIDIKKNTYTHPKKCYRSVPWAGHDAGHAHDHGDDHAHHVANHDRDGQQRQDDVRAHRRLAGRDVRVKAWQGVSMRVERVKACVKACQSVSMRVKACQACEDDKDP